MSTPHFDASSRSENNTSVAPKMSTHTRTATTRDCVSAGKPDAPSTSVAALPACTKNCSAFLHATNATMATPMRLEMSYKRNVTKSPMSE